jgi:hypothetical protein
VVDELAPWAPAVELLSEQGRDPTRSWSRLTYLTDFFGPRLSGSQTLEDAIAWSLELMNTDGLTAVRRQPVQVPHWVRNEEWGRIVHPVSRPLHLLGLGGTVGTAPHSVRGSLEVVASLEELDHRAGQLRDKIVLINQAMPPYDEATEETHYGDTVGIRYYGPARAGRVGARALLVPSVTARSLQTPHTGSLQYESGTRPIPAAAVTVEDAELLARLRGHGPVTVEFFLGAELRPDAESGNAIGELRGRERPDEIVLLGAHIDSWDVGTGAADDGAGCIMVLEAVHLLQSAGLVPRRTVRVVLFTNEENGMRGAYAYAEAYGHQRHVAALEADSGGGVPRGFRITGTATELQELQQYAPLFAPWGATNVQAGFAGVDLLPLTRQGVLGLGLHQDASHYFDVHHSAADTVEKIDRHGLQQGAAVLALMTYILAER